jgi:uncharacterized protein (TIGR04255 family)
MSSVPHTPMPSIDDLFKPYDREVYKRAPDVLLRVIMQVRFPRNLRLESNQPVEFQEAVIKNFPLYERTMNMQLPDGVQLSPDMMQMIAAQAGVAASAGHQFLSEDHNTTISLTSDQMAVAVGPNYTTWDDFREVLEEAIGALTKLYKVPFFTRVGLRYQDAIHRETLNIPDSPWTSLIQRKLLGAFPFDKFESSTLIANHQIALTLPENLGRMAIRHGLVIIPGKTGQAYGLDFDLSCQPKIETSDVLQRLDRFHDVAGRAFRWSLTDELRQVLGPEPLPQRQPRQAASA